MQKWLSVIGMGEEGLTGLSSIAQTLLQQATLIVGGRRHLAWLSDHPQLSQQPQLAWGSPIETTLEQIIGYRGQPVAVLASGDPLCYGIGATLLRQIPIDEITFLPVPSAFSLACARLGWNQTEIETLSLCGRDPNLLHQMLYPGAQLLILSADRQTPLIVADKLIQAGYGHSRLTILEHLGGVKECQHSRTAHEWQTLGQSSARSTHLGDGIKIADLNTIAITCVADFDQPAWARIPGLPDAAFHHDGQLTKREVRAITLSRLAPLPGQLLWDVGAGCGSIGIEWLRSHPRCRAIAIEQHPSRLHYIAENAAALGVPHLQIIAGSAPDALAPLPHPDAIFIGGGLTADRLLETCWQALKPGGRLVTNAVTIESEQLLFTAHHQWGGELSRIAIQRAEPIGQFLGWKALAPITQWQVIKPRK
ncbi:MAG: precorrin-6y C5,15-methyltransferase (decarboxylating) subunit CbiE [Elainella sp. Prado103]|nr:precorrin-6y C5,15-methyltransferase (decarboxylating) subunit CbiE [Elainella sp. Prado103]